MIFLVRKEQTLLICALVQVLRSHDFSPKGTHICVDMYIHIYVYVFVCVHIEKGWRESHKAKTDHKV